MPLKNNMTSETVGSDSRVVAMPVTTFYTIYRFIRKCQ